MRPGRFETGQPRGMGKPRQEMKLRLHNGPKKADDVRGYYLEVRMSKLRAWYHTTVGMYKVCQQVDTAYGSMPTTGCVVCVDIG